MDKRSFIKQLEEALRPLNADERREIISFYEDRFNTAKFEGKSEQDIIKELESPREIANNVLNEYGVTVEKATPSYTVNILSIVGILCFDVLVSTWLVTVAVVVPLSLAASWFSYFGAFLVFKYSPFFVALTQFIGITAGYVIYLFVIVLLIELGLRIVCYVLSWHVQVFTGNKDHVLVGKLQNASLIKLIQRWNIPLKTYGIVLGSAILTLIASVIILSFVNDDAVGIGGVLTYDSVETYETTTDTYTYDTDSVDEIHVNFDLMTVSYSADSIDEIIVEHYHNYDNGFIENHSDTKLLTLTDTPLNSNWFESLLSVFERNNIFDGHHVQELHITVPNNFELTSLDIDVVSNPISVANFEGEQLQLSGVSSSISVIESNFGSGGINNVSGNILISDLEIEELRIDTVSSVVTIENVISSSDDSKVHVDVVSGDVDLSEVYVRDVNISTVSGDITYYNDDTTYVLDHLHISTVSGSTSHSVPNKK